MNRYLKVAMLLNIVFFTIISIRFNYRWYIVSINLWEIQQGSRDKIIAMLFKIIK